jgi:hypothetical protein
MDHGKQVPREVLAEHMGDPMRVCCAIKHVAINFT